MVRFSLHCEFSRARQRIAWAALLASTAVLSSPLLSPAETHYVSKTGSNTFPYTSWATAADTVARAVEAAAEWDTIRIASGHYVTDTIVMKRGQVLVGAGMDSTILDSLPALPLYALHISDSCVVRDVAFVGDYDPTELAKVSTEAGILDAQTVAATGTVIVGDEDEAFWVTTVRFEHVDHAIYTYSNDFSSAGRTCQVDSCEFFDFSQAIYGPGSSVEVRNSEFRFDQSAGAGVFVDYGEVVVERCMFIGRRTGSGLNSTIGVRTVFVDPVVIRNCLFDTDMLGTAMDLNREMVPDSVETGLVQNNTMIGWNAHIRTERSGIVVTNNIFSRVNAGAIYEMSLCLSSYNLTWDNTPWDSGAIRPLDTIPNDLTGNSGNLNAYPMFTDTIVFQLQAFSPAIDRGHPSILDLDGSRSDIGWTGAPGGMDYVKLNYPPKSPRALAANPSGSEIGLLWRRNFEADLFLYRLYRDTLPIATSNPAFLVDSSFADTAVTDSTVQPGRAYYYRLTAVDMAGLESSLSEEVHVIGSGVHDNSDVVPTSFELRQPSPNPFNASTKVEIVLHAMGHLEIAVFDIRGARVATLHEGKLGAGPHTWLWQPSQQSSGVYFLRARVGNESRVRKLLLLK